MTSIRKLQEEAAREKDPEARKRLQELIDQRTRDRSDPWLKIHDRLLGTPEQYMTEAERKAKSELLSLPLWGHILIISCIVGMFILILWLSIKYGYQYDEY